MKVTKDGLTIKGNGTFSGDISAATGTFKGSINVNEKNFYVDSSGNVTISGKLKVNGTGSIAGWTITANSIYKGNTVLSGSTGNITMGSGTLLNGVKFGTSGYSSIYTESYGTVWTHGDKMNKLVNSYILLD
jgi:cytoskeletal protein CcmA (bactofilin family)